MNRGGQVVAIPKRHSKNYQLCLYYLNFSIVFEVLDQVLFLRLLGVPYVAQTMMILRLLVDMFFVLACFSYGVRISLFRGLLVNLMVIIILFGGGLGIIYQNPISEILKDLILFSLFVLKFVIFKGIFTSKEDLTDIFDRLKKYCVLTLYVAVFSFLVMQVLRRVGFMFYEQGISNLEWYVSYALSTNRTAGALLGVLVSLLLAKRMVFISCVAIFMIPAVKNFLKIHPRYFFTMFLLMALLAMLLQFAPINLDTFKYAIRIDFDSIFGVTQKLDLDTFLIILQLLDTGRYIESQSAILQLETYGVLFGGGFGFDYVDAHTGEYVSNAHFSPVGMITKVGVIGAILFYFLLFYGFFSAMRLNNPFVLLCGYYVFSVIVGSLFAWNFFLSSPLLPFALAVSLYGGRAIKPKLLPTLQHPL